MNMNFHRFSAIKTFKCEGSRCCRSGYMFEQRYGVDICYHDPGLNEIDFCEC